MFFSLNEVFFLNGAKSKIKKKIKNKIKDKIKNKIQFKKLVNGSTFVSHDFAANSLQRIPLVKFIFI